MEERKKIVCQDSWGYCQDPGLDLYCHIEGIDQSIVLRRAKQIKVHRSLRHLPLRHEQQKPSLARAAMLILFLYASYQMGLQ